MKRSIFTALVALALAVPALPVLADGSLTVKNATVDGSVGVQVRIGSSMDDATPAANATLKRGESVTLDATNLQYFWRREQQAGSGTWTDWQRVDPRYSNQYVEF
ncbi:MAG: hypothetical protein JO101_03960 [Candidatus Eremiobacteraeota bacterium]|nr:hypothetical protein [Candidatus Eremiobacteraeota bacterium]MBV8354450.1 hypothetical protein [Candidatus Eremiobacteraeota bacterium]